MWGSGVVAIVPTPRCMGVYIGQGKVVRSTHKVCDHEVRLSLKPRAGKCSRRESCSCSCLVLTGSGVVIDCE
jgi:hypothetical protein